MADFLLDLGKGVMVRLSQVVAVMPLAMMPDDTRAELLGRYEGATAVLELGTGSTVPCFKPMEELTEFLQRYATGQGTW